MANAIGNMQNNLDKLTSDDFLISLGVFGSPHMLWDALHRSMLVCEIRELIISGVISEDMVRGFVAELAAKYVPNQCFGYDLTLAALAVILEPIHLAYIDEYLIILERLSKYSEFEFAPKVAEVCIAMRR